MPVVYAIERISENVWILWVFIFLSLGMSTCSNVASTKKSRSYFGRKGAGLWVAL